MTRPFPSFPALVLLLLPGLADAGIIGMLWSHSGNNVTIRGEEDNGRLVVRVEAPATAPCPLRLFRHNASELDRVAPQAGPEGAALAFGLWFERACYFKHYDVPARGRGPERPLSAAFDVETEILSRPSLAGHLADFKSGALRLAFCLQQSGPGAEGQEVTCPTLGRDDLRAKRVVYRSDFRRPRDIDLGLTEPKPLRDDVRLSEAYVGPAAGPSERIHKSPTLSARISGLRLSLADAHNSGEAPYQGRRFRRFFIQRGVILGAAAILQAAKRGESFCEIVLTQPESLAAGETRFDSGVIDVSWVDAGGGHAPFSFGPASMDPDIARHGYWAQGIGLVPVGTRLAGDTLISHFACAKPHGNRDAASGVTAGEAREHLRQGGLPFVEFLSDYPGYQR